MKISGNAGGNIFTEHTLRTAQSILVKFEKLKQANVSKHVLENAENIVNQACNAAEISKATLDSNVGQKLDLMVADCDFAMRRLTKGKI